MKYRILSFVLRLVAAIGAASALGVFLVPFNVRQRGYFAFGGEWLLIVWIAVLVLWLTADKGR